MRWIIEVPGRRRRRRARGRESRRGVLGVKTIVLLPAIMAFLALAVDMGSLVNEKTKMQNAVDAAALAAAGEIVAAVDEEGDQGDGEIDVNSIAEQRARDMAARVAELNHVYVDPQRDVRFGRSTYNEATEEWSVSWDETPYNVVQVVARRDVTNPVPDDADDPDGRPVQLPFARAIGLGSREVTVSATSFVESRDIVVVMDFSRSMNFDSGLDVSNLSETEVIDNEWEIYQALGSPDLGPIITPSSKAEFDGEIYYQETRSDNGMTGTVRYRFNEVDVELDCQYKRVKLYYYDYDGNYHTKSIYEVASSGTYDIQDYDSSGRRIYMVKFYKDVADTVTLSIADYDEKDTGDWHSLDEKLVYFGLDSKPWPYPQGSWREFLRYCRYEPDRGKSSSEWGRRMYNTGRPFRYTGAAFVNYLLERRCAHDETPQLADTPHYPFHAVKNGTTLFLEFLENLDFGDAVGMVCYATTAQWLDGPINCVPNVCNMTVDLSSEPISRQYTDLNTLQRHTQAAHFSSSTNMGDGIVEASSLLAQHARYGSRKTMLLMTDGNANTYPGSFSAPDGFDWNDIVDADGNLYTPGGSYSEVQGKTYALYKAYEAVRDGVTIHTMSVGAGADSEIMEVIAIMGGGVHINVPGGTTIAEMQDELNVAFNKIAAKVPPPRLIRATVAP